MAVNRTVSNHIATSNLTRGRQWIIHRKSNVDVRNINDRPSQAIVWDGNPGLTAAPRPVEPPRHAGEMAAELNVYKEMIQEISGVRDVSQGENVSGGRSNSVVRTLSSQAEQGRKGLQNRYRRSLTRLGRMSMQTTKRFIREDRWSVITGKNGQLSSMLLKKTDFDRCYDVRVLCEDGPNTLMEKKSYAIDLATMGLFDLTDPQQKTVFLKLLDHPDLDALVDLDETAERVRAHEENLALLEGTREIQPEPFENQLLHAMAHTAFMREVRTREAMEKDPEARQRLMAHRDAHLMALQGAEAAELPPDESSPASGSPPSAGPTSAPSPAGPGGGAMPMPGATSEAALF
jgi:hypothetical protein